MARLQPLECGQSSKIPIAYIYSNETDYDEPNLFKVEE